MCDENVDAELMYLAGLFDGEGSAYISRGNANHNYGTHLKPTIGICMCDDGPMRSWAAFFGGKVSVIERESPRKPKYEWRANGRGSGEIAKILLPHSRIKRKRKALLCVIRLAETLRERNLGSVPIPIELREYREQLYKRCKQLNAKGDKALPIVEQIIDVPIIVDTPQMSLW